MALPLLGHFICQMGFSGSLESEPRFDVDVDEDFLVEVVDFFLPAEGPLRKLNLDLEVNLIPLPPLRPPPSACPCPSDSSATSGRWTALLRDDVDDDDDDEEEDDDVDDVLR